MWGVTLICQHISFLHAKNGFRDLAKEIISLAEAPQIDLRQTPPMFRSYAPQRNRAADH